MDNRSIGTKIALQITKGVMHVVLNIIFYLLVVMIVIKVCTFTYDFSYQLFGDVSVTQTAEIDREFVINKGESTMSVASKLEKNHLIVDRYSFYVRTKITDQNILPGIYKLNSSMNYDDILEIITGKNATEESN